jgi:aminopeptidase N
VFAQSFPNTIPYSEGIGFIAHPTTEEDLDQVLYVTAHELAHQWWGHQAIGAWAQGSNVLSESLASYAALALVERRVGPTQVRRYLKHELDSYLRGRGAERRAEPTLATVTRSPYVWYRKGALALYALKDYLGEARLNAALRAYLEKVRFQEAPYTTITEFIDVLKAAAPDDRKYLVTDLFETITLYDNRAVEATWREAPDQTFIVTLKVSSRKLRADDQGREHEVALDDLVDIGVLAGDGRQERTLFLEKKRITQPEMTFEIPVRERPSRAGIDPFNKLIDRVSDDNLVRADRGR